MVTHQASRTRRLFVALGLNVWVAAAFIIAQLGIGLAVFGLRSAGVDFQGINPAIISLIFAFLAYLVALLIVYAVQKYRSKNASIGDAFAIKRLVSWTDIGLALIGAIPYVILAQLLLSGAVELLPFFDQDQTQDSGFSNLTQRYEFLAAFLALVIFAPIAEEALFRGYLYTKLRAIQGVVVSTIFVSATFAVLHAQLNVGIDVFALSLVLCVLREITGSIWAGVILHMMKNGLAYYILFITPMV